MKKHSLLAVLCGLNLERMIFSMEKAAVIYKTKYGTTKKYAEWISEELGADLYEFDEVNTQILMEYDTILYGGGMYAGGVLGFSSFARKSYESIKDKNIILFGVGASLNKKNAVEAIQKNNMTEEMYWKIKPFFLRGGLDYKRMKKRDKLAMFIMKKIIQAKKLTDEDSLGILGTYGKTVDFTDKKSIEPIIEYVNAVSK